MKYLAPAALTLLISAGLYKTQDVWSKAAYQRVIQLGWNPQVAYTAETLEARIQEGSLTQQEAEAILGTVYQGPWGGRRATDAQLDVLKKYVAQKQQAAMQT